MLHVIFVLFVATYGLKTELFYPSFREALLILKPCIRQRMSLEYCMERYMEEVNEALSWGDLELDIPGYDPYDHDEFYCNFYNGVYVGSVQLKNIRITGLSYYAVHGLEFHSRYEFAQQIKFVVHYFQLRLMADCYLNGTLNSPTIIRGNDLVMTLKDLEVKVTIDGQYYYARREKYFKVHNISANVQLMSSMELILTFENDSSLISNQRSYVNENKAALYDQIVNYKIVPEIQQAFATFIHTIADKICDKFPVKELYPF